jgi:opacity protein-like surface antigen
MKNDFFVFRAGWVMLIATLGSESPLTAAEPVGYMRGDVGPAFGEDTKLERFFGEPVSGNRVQLETGVRFDFAFGAHFTPWFAAEMELGWIYNGVKSVEGTTDDDLAFSQAPFLVNVIFQLPNKTGFVPFIGGGGGGSLNVLRADNFTLGATTVDGYVAAATYAYQAFGGLRYDFAKKMGVSVIYKYSVTGDSEWEPYDDFVIGTNPTAKLDCMRTHAITAAFTYRF